MFSGIVTSLIDVQFSNALSPIVTIPFVTNTSVAVAEKVLPSVVGIKVTYQISSFFGSSTWNLPLTKTCLPL